MRDQDLVLNKILRSLPKLKKMSDKIIYETQQYSPKLSEPHKYFDWLILDQIDSIYLLCTPGTGNRGGGVIPQFPSFIAIVKSTKNTYSLLFLEEYRESTISGILDTDNSQAIIIRVWEYDDGNQTEGNEDVYLINYKTGETKCVDRFWLGQTHYNAGDIKLSLNGDKNWLIFSRTFYGKIINSTILYLYDLNNYSLIIKLRFPYSILKDFSLISDYHNRLKIIDDDDDVVYFDVDIDKDKQLTVSYSENIYGQYKYDIALSHTGKSEIRDIALQIADNLKKSFISVFYDKYDKYDIMKKNEVLPYLRKIYLKKTRTILIIVSRDYGKSPSWTKNELDIIIERKEHDDTKFLYLLKMDDVTLPNLENEPSIHYNETSIEELCKFIRKELVRVKIP